MHRKPRCALIVLLALVSLAPAAQESANLHFVDAPLSEILVALGSAMGRSVVPDASVTGRATYYFDGVSFDEAIDGLAKRFDLFVTRENGIVSVSAIRVEMDADDSITVEAPRVTPRLLIERLSRATGIPVLAERLPDREVGFYTSGSDLARVLAQLVAGLPDHDLSRRDGAWVIAPVDAAAPRPANPDWIVREGDRYAIDSTASTLGTLLGALFGRADREYQLLARRDALLPPLSHAARPFDDLLSIVVEQADASWTLVDDVYYVVDADPRAAAARAATTSVVDLEHVGVGSLLELLPQEALVGVTVRADRERHALSITGPSLAVERVEDLIDRLDVAPEGRAYERFTLSTMSADTLAAIMPAHLRTVGIVSLPDASEFVALVSVAQREQLERFIESVDRPEESHLVVLHHTSVDALLDHPPPGLRPGSIIPTGDPGRFFLRGTTTDLHRLEQSLSLVDLPRAQIRYHLLIVQYDEGHALDYELDLSNALSTPDSEQAFLGRLGNLLALDFDIVSTLGYQFAARLDAAISESTASIVADTTMNALAGEVATFRSTNTYRYRDAAPDDEAAAVVREITSGLSLEITGTVQGDTVTMEVTASVSRRGTDESSSGNPPSTSEKVVRTQVRTAIGRPVVLSGLRQSEASTHRRGAPIVARVPLIGWILGGRRENREESEVAIYIIPRVDRGGNENDEPESLCSIYERYFGSAW